MDMKEKLAVVVCDATQKTNYKCEFNCEKKGKCAYCIVMAEQMIANGVTVQEWISVKDHPPETDGIYLVCTTWQGIVSEPKYGKYIKPPAQEGYWLVLTEFGYYPNSTVSHWMPRPKSPKGE